MRTSIATALLVGLVAVGCSGCTAVGTAPATTAPPADASAPAPSERSAPSSPSASASASATATATASSTPTSSASVQPAVCRTEQLHVAVPTGSNGASHADAPAVTSIRFTNVGRAACSMDGHPGVSFVAGSDGHQVGAAAHRDGVERGRVELEPGGSATAELTIALPGDLCADPTAVRGYRIYPPDQTAALFVKRTGEACAEKTRAPELTVGGVEKAK